MLWSACIMSHLSVLAKATAWLWGVFCAGTALYSPEDEPHSGILHDSFHVSEQIYTSPQSLQKKRSYTKL